MKSAQAEEIAMHVYLRVETPWCAFYTSAAAARSVDITRQRTQVIGSHWIGVWARVHALMHASVYLCLCVHACVHVSVHSYVCTYARVFCACVCVCIHVCFYVCVCTRARVCIPRKGCQGNQSFAAAKACSEGISKHVLRISGEKTMRILQYWFRLTPQHCPRVWVSDRISRMPT